MDSLPAKNSFQFLEKYIDREVSREELEAFLKDLILNNPLLNFPDLPKVEISKLSRENRIAEYNIYTNTILLSEKAIDLILKGNYPLLDAVNDLGHEFEHFLQYKFKFSGVENLSKAPTLARSLNFLSLTRDEFFILFNSTCKYFTPEYMQKFTNLSPEERNNLITQIWYGSYLQEPMEKDARAGGIHLMQCMLNYWSTNEMSTQKIKEWCKIQEARVDYYKQKEAERLKNVDGQMIIDFENQLKFVPVDELVKMGRQIQNINVFVDGKPDKNLLRAKSEKIKAFKKCVQVVFREQNQDIINQYFSQAFANEDYLMIDALGSLFTLEKESGLVRGIQTKIVPVLKSNTVTSNIFNADYTKILTLDQCYDVVSTNLKDRRPRFCPIAIENCKTSIYNDYTLQERDSFESDISVDFIKSTEKIIDEIKTDDEDLIWKNFYDLKIVGELLDSRESVKQALAELDSYEKALNEHIIFTPKEIQDRNFVKAYGEKELNNAHAFEDIIKI